MGVPRGTPIIVSWLSFGGCLPCPASQDCLSDPTSAFVGAASSMTIIVCMRSAAIRSRTLRGWFQLCALPASSARERRHTAVNGMRSFLDLGHGAEAERLGWPHDELFRVPPVWARVDLCGAALLIGDREVVDITATEIRIKTASGATTAFLSQAKGRLPAPLRGAPKAHSQQLPRRLRRAPPAGNRVHRQRLPRQHRPRP